MASPGGFGASWGWLRGQFGKGNRFFYKKERKYFPWKMTKPKDFHFPREKYVFFSVCTGPFDKPDLNFEPLLYPSSQEMSICAVFQCIYNSLNLFSTFSHHFISRAHETAAGSQHPSMTPCKPSSLWLIFSSLAPCHSLQQVVSLPPLTLVHHKPSSFSYLFFGGKKWAGWGCWGDYFSVLWNTEGDGSEPSGAGNRGMDGKINSEERRV